MPRIPQKPSLNHEVIKGMGLKELVELHPLADAEHLEKEWKEAKGADAKVEEKKK